MPDSLVIPSHFNGPPESGHGGYTCGSVARFIDGAAEVELRAPPPLDTPMEVVRENGSVEVKHGDTLVARASRVDFELDEVPSIDLAAAQRATDLERWAEHHPFPTCFACGPLRDDGFREFPGPVPGRDVYACTWTPEDASPLMVWTALDCPTSAPVMRPEANPPVVLARLALRQFAEVPTGRPLPIVSWELGEEGRKKHSAAALFDEDGGLCAYSRALWIELRPS